MKFVIVAVVAMLLVGCGKTETVDGVERMKLSTHIFAVNGKPLDCVGRGHELSCNWDKYNKQEGKH